MRPIVGTLLPPNTPAYLPHGLDRGGIFEADYVSPQYIDAQRRTIPTDSPLTENVTTDVFMQRIGFKSPDQVRMITKMPMQGYGQLPTVVHPFGQLPTVVHPFGQMVQGMGPQPGFRRIPADRPPAPIRNWAPVARPHGAQEGGIFGRGTVINGMAVGPGLPGVPTKEIMQVRQITGFGAGPDGIG